MKSKLLEGGGDAAMMRAGHVYEDRVAFLLRQAGVKHLPGKESEGIVDAALQGVVQAHLDIFRTSQGVEGVFNALAHCAAKIIYSQADPEAYLGEFIRRVERMGVEGIRAPAQGEG